MKYIQANGVVRNAKKIKDKLLKYLKMTRQTRRWTGHHEKIKLLAQFLKRKL